MSAKKVSLSSRPKTKPENTQPEIELTAAQRAFLEGGAAEYQNEPATEEPDQSATEEPNKRMTFDVPESLHKRVKLGCVDRGTTIRNLVLELLEREFPLQPKASLVPSQTSPDVPESPNSENL